MSRPPGWSTRTLDIVTAACRLRATREPALTGGRHNGGRRPGDVGWTWADIAREIGFTPAALEKARQRCGWPDPHTGRPILNPYLVEVQTSLEPVT